MTGAVAVPSGQEPNQTSRSSGGESCDHAASNVAQSLSRDGPGLALLGAQRLGLDRQHELLDLVVGDLVDLAHGPGADQAVGEVARDRLGLGLQRVAVAGAAGGEPEGHHVALVVGPDRAAHELDLPLPADRAVLDDRAEVEIDVVAGLQAVDQSGRADADPRDRAGRVAAEQRLRRLQLRVVGDRHQQHHRDLVGDPQLHRAHAAAVLARAAGVHPVLLTAAPAAGTRSPSARRRARGRTGTTGTRRRSCPPSPASRPCPRC